MVVVLFVIVAINLVLGAFVIGISISSDRSIRAE
jgi:Kef-type K+ transport system membrane component KefB